MAEVVAQAEVAVGPIAPVLTGRATVGADQPAVAVSGGSEDARGGNTSCASRRTLLPTPPLVPSRLYEIRVIHRGTDP